MKKQSVCISFRTFHFVSLIVVALATNCKFAGLVAQDTSESDQQLARYFEKETRQLADRCLENVSTLDQWKKQQSVLREQLFEMLGLSPRPPKTDLKVTYTGTADHDEFVVKKLHYQSRPGLYVTGNLYLPKKIGGKKIPAVLYVCGHGRVFKNGKSYGNKVHYHHHGSWFARNGYACLTIDTLQLGEIEGIHHGTYREKMWWWLNRGYTPAGVEAWNCIRALDLLQSLPEVDGNRLGVTGRSGGGAYSWWIAALDERIQCAVPVAGITDMENHVIDGCVEGHCDCMFMVNTYRWDYPMVAALVAPRPLLISNTDSDGIFPLNGVYRTYQKVKKIYNLYGKGNQVAFHITAGPHKDTQELRVHAFRWMNHYLKNDDDLIRIPADKFFQPEQLKVFAELPTDQKNTKIHESFVPAAIHSEPSTAQQWNQTSEKLIESIREKCFRGLPKKSSALQLVSDATKETKTNDGVIKMSKFNFESQQHVPLSLTLLHTRPLDKVERVEVLVLGDGENDALKYFEKGKPADWIPELVSRIGGGSREDQPSLAKLLISTRSAIALMTPRGVGNNSWNPNLRFQTQARRRFYLLGQTADTMRVYDIQRAVDAVREISGNGVKMGLNAKGKMAINATYASLLGRQVDSLTLVEPTSSHRNGPFYLNVRRVLDVPEAIAIAARHSRIHIKTKTPDAFQFASRASGLGGSDPVLIEIVK